MPVTLRVMLEKGIGTGHGRSRGGLLLGLEPRIFSQKHRICKVKILLGGHCNFCIIVCIIMKQSRLSVDMIIVNIQCQTVGKCKL